MADKEPTEDEEGEPKKRKLSYKQRRFVDAYVGEARGNGTKAAIIAGYSKKTAREIARENLTKPDIQQALSEMVSEYALTPEAVLAGYMDIWENSNIRNLLKIQEDGSYSFTLTDDDSQLREALRFVRKWSTKDGDITVEMMNPMDALDRLAKFHGLLVERSVVGIEDMSGKSDDELRAIASGKAPGRR